MYLFGWKQEFNCVRSLPGTCHFWQSHDARLALRSGECGNSVVISDTLPVVSLSPATGFLFCRFQKLFFPLLSYTCAKSSVYLIKQNRLGLWYRGWTRGCLEAFSSCSVAALLLCDSLPPVLPVLSRVQINGCVYCGKGEDCHLVQEMKCVVGVVWGGGGGYCRAHPPNTI